MKFNDDKHRNWSYASAPGDHVHSVLLEYDPDTDLCGFLFDRPHPDNQPYAMWPELKIPFKTLKRELELDLPYEYYRGDIKSFRSQIPTRCAMELLRRYILGLPVPCAPETGIERYFRELDAAANLQSRA